MDLTQAVTPRKRARRPAVEPRRRPRAAGRFDLSPPPWVVQLFDCVGPRSDGAGAEIAGAEIAGAEIAGAGIVGAEPARGARAGGGAGTPEVTVADSPEFTLV